jgi:hypothetical protein
VAASRATPRARESSPLEAALPGARQLELDLEALCPSGVRSTRTPSRGRACRGAVGRPQRLEAPTRAGDARGPGRQNPHVWSDERSTLDLLEPGLTLFAARDEPAWASVAAAVTTRVPVDDRLLDPIAGRAIGAPGGSELLARSDGTPVGLLPAGADPLCSCEPAVAPTLR